MVLFLLDKRCTVLTLKLLYAQMIYYHIVCLETGSLFYPYC